MQTTDAPTLEDARKLAHDYADTASGQRFFIDAARSYLEDHLPYADPHDPYDTIHEAADSAANLIYTRTIRDTFYAIDGLRWLGEYASEYGGESVEHVYREGSGQYPAGTDALAVVAIYHAVYTFLVEWAGV